MVLCFLKVLVHDGLGKGGGEHSRTADSLRSTGLEVVGHDIGRGTHPHWASVGSYQWLSCFFLNFYLFMIEREREREREAET